MAGKRRLNKDDETITIELDEGLLRRIATSLEVRAAIKNIQFDLTLDQIATFQAMRRRIELAWDEPWKSDQRETRNKEHGTGTRPLEPRSEVVPPRE